MELRDVAAHLYILVRSGGVRHVWLQRKSLNRALDGGQTLDSEEEEEEHQFRWGNSARA